MTTVKPTTQKNIYRVTAVDNSGEIYTHTCSANDKRDSVKKTQDVIKGKEGWVDREFIIIDVKSPSELQEQTIPTSFTYETTKDDYLTQLMGDTNE